MKRLELENERLRHDLERSQVSRTIIIITWQIVLHVGVL